MIPRRASGRQSLGTHRAMPPQHASAFFPLEKYRTVYVIAVAPSATLSIDSNRLFTGQRDLSARKSPLAQQAAHSHYLQLRAGEKPAQ